MKTYTMHVHGNSCFSAKNIFKPFICVTMHEYTCGCLSVCFCLYIHLTGFLSCL